MGRCFLHAFLVLLLAVGQASAAAAEQKNCDATPALVAVCACCDSGDCCFARSDRPVPPAADDRAIQSERERSGLPTVQKFRLGGSPGLIETGLQIVAVAAPRPPPTPALLSVFLI